MCREKCPHAVTFEGVYNRSVRSRILFFGFAAIVMVLIVDARAGRAQPNIAAPIDIFPETIHPGDVARIQIAGETNFTVEIFGKTFKDGLVGIDLDVKPGAYPLRIRSLNGRFRTGSVQVLPKTFAIRRLTVAPSFVEPPPDEIERIARELKLTEGIFHTSTPRKWHGPFVLPVDGKPTSNFGTRSYFNGQRRSPHAGIDFVAGAGTPIKAANHGVVALAEPLYFTGNTVLVDYGDGLFSLFAHLSEFRVKTGEAVTPETIVGLLGATGRVTGPHLHWSVRLQGSRVDPLSLVAATQ
jgi:peptidase M23-like protein